MGVGNALLPLMPAMMRAVSMTNCASVSRVRKLEASLPVSPAPPGGAVEPPGSASRIALVRALTARSRPVVLSPAMPVPLPAEPALFSLLCMTCTPEMGEGLV